MDRWCLAHIYLGVVVVIHRWKKVDINRFCAWKIIGKYIWNLTNPNTIPIITKKTTNACLFKDPKYKYNDKYANSQNDKHKYDNFMVFGVWNPPKLWYPNIFVPNYAGPWPQYSGWAAWQVAIIAYKSWQVTLFIGKFLFKLWVQSFYSYLTQGRIIHWAKGGYSPGAPQDRGHHIGWL